MTPGQKKRAQQILRRFEQADPMTRQADNAAVDMAALLQELIDAPEPEQPNQSEQHLEMVNAPAPSVPDDFYNAVANLSVELEELVAETSGVYGLHLNGDPSPWEEILEGGRFERISSLHVVQNLLATRQPKQPEQPAQPAELVRDAERYRWLRNWTRGAYGIDSNPAFILPHVPTMLDQNIMSGSVAQHLDNAIDAAIERDKLKGGA